MSQVGAYFDHILLTALGSPKVKRVEKIRREEDATGRIGFMRCRLTLINDDLLELTECVEVQAEGLIVAKYRHHRQDKESYLIKRWDNAPLSARHELSAPPPRRLRGERCGAPAGAYAADFAPGPPIGLSKSDREDLLS